MAKKKKRRPQGQVVGLLGVGIDGDDGESRITQTDHFVLAGGSAETHERMQETAARFEERLDATGKPLVALPVAQVVDLLRQARRE